MTPEKEALVAEAKRLVLRDLDKWRCDDIFAAIDALAALTDVPEPLTVEQIRDILREGALVTQADAWALAEKLHAAMAEVRKQFKVKT